MQPVAAAFSRPANTTLLPSLLFSKARDEHASFCYSKPHFRSKRRLHTRHQHERAQSKLQNFLFVVSPLSILLL